MRLFLGGAVMADALLDFAAAILERGPEAPAGNADVVGEGLLAVPARKGLDLPPWSAATAAYARKCRESNSKSVELAKVKDPV